MVFVNPAVRLARHRRLAVAMRRHLDRLLEPSGYRYERTEIEKEHVTIHYRAGNVLLSVTEHDANTPSGTTYRVTTREHVVTLGAEEELPAALSELVERLGLQSP